MSVTIDGFRHVTERESGPWICCAPASGAMVSHYAIGTPATLDYAHRIRAAVPKAHTGGLKPSELRAGVRNASGARLELELVAVTREAIAEQLRAGWAIAVALTFGRLPTRLRRYSPAFTGGHMAVLCGISSSGGSWGWFDPLAPAGWTGEWIAPGDVLPALWTDTGSAAGAPRGGDMARFVQSNGYGIGAGRTLHVEAGELWRYLDGSPGGPFSAAGDVPCLGLIDSARGEWAVAIYTGRPYADGGKRTTIVAVTSSRLPVDRPPAPAPGPTPEQLEAARLEGARAEWNRWQTSLGIPPRP